MMYIDIIDVQDKCKIVDKFLINDDFLELEKGAQAVHDTVVYYRNNIRAWTASVKDRSEVSGGGVKPFRQKGTGRARAGSIRSPIHVGGGITFGPNSSQKPAIKKLNKKIFKLALKRIFSEKVTNSLIKIIKNIDYNNYKTKYMLNIIKSLNLINNKVLIIVKNYVDKFINSITNIKNIEFCKSNSVNTYKLLNCKYVLIFNDALIEFIKRL